MARPTLYSYNTVERLLRGDFFHTTNWNSVTETLDPYPGDWPLIGIGTTNWYRRNGETIIRGTVGSPQVIWSDPEGHHPMHTLDLLTTVPDDAGPALVSPSLEEDDQQAAFPFLALGVCDPASAIHWKSGPCSHLHEWISTRLAEENIGLAAVSVRAHCTHVKYASAFYLPLEGLELKDGYNAADNLKLAESEADTWQVGGIYAANPTLQHIISVEGLPLHLHGQEEGSGNGGHVIQLQVESAEIQLWPLKDLKMEIRNLDKTWVPIRNLSL